MFALLLIFSPHLSAEVSMDVPDKATVSTKARALERLVDAFTFDGKPFKVSLQRQIGFGATATVFCGAIVDESRAQLLAVKVFREPQDEHDREASR
ncbi:hypothetical protein AURDEDRAFT_174089 [Auricularia subglabra TFB-10046 SS5]|nr:hypothetical protein AURDEDRAFT_174089 [Auricularia subglabra TFB-10046 SS5]